MDNSNLISKYVDISKNYFDISDFENAKKYCQMCIDLGDFASYHNMGVITLYDGKLQESLFYFNISKCMFRESYYYMGLAYKNLKDYQEAENCLIENDEPRAYYLIAEINYAQQNYEAAEFWYHKAASLGDKRADVKLDIKFI